MMKCSKNTLPKKVMEHGLFLKRIKKTLYYGSSAITKCQTISRPLADYASQIFSESHKNHSLNRLTFVTAGSCNVTPCSLILAIIYLDRLKDTDPDYSRRITPTELFLVSMIVSTKFYCGYDEDIYLSEWAEYGNMSVEVLKKLELEFLSALDWNAYVSNEQFFEKLESVELSLAKQEGLLRGWLTYTELIRLLPSLEIAKQIFYYNTVMLCSYAAGFITIASAFFLVSHIPGNALYNNSNNNKTHQLDKSTNTTCCVDNKMNIDSKTIFDMENNINSTINIELEEDCNIIDNMNLSSLTIFSDQNNSFIDDIILSESIYENYWKNQYDLQYNCCNINNWLPNAYEDDKRNDFKLNNILSLFLYKFL